MNLGTKLRGAFGVILLLIVVIAGAGLWAIKAMDHARLMRDAGSSFSMATLRMRAAEKDFFSKLDESYVDAHGDVFGAAEEQIHRLSQHDDSEELREMEERLLDYRRLFEQAADLTRSRGLDEKSGLRGALRNAIRTFETEVKAHERDDLLVTMLMLRRHEKDYLLRGTDKYVSKFEDRVEVMRQRLADSGLDSSVTASLEGQVNIYRDEFLALVAADRIRRDVEAQLTNSAEGAIEASDALLVRLESSAQAEIDFAHVVLWIAIAIAVTLGLLCALTIPGRILIPIRNMMSVVEGMANGDLTRQAAVSGNDELARMGKALNSAMSDMSSSIGSIRTNAESLTSAAEKFSVVSHQLGSAAEETASQANTVSDGADSVSQNVETVAAAAEEMNSCINEIAQNASTAADVATRAVGLTKSTNETIDRLGSSSAEIGNVIGVITSIAEQTNLLALNATIEAARAGEMGKGFAVVANEVKELATETARATEDVRTKVEAIQCETKSAVDATSEIDEVIRKISSYQVSIAGAVEEQEATTREIARNMNEASTRSRSIAQNVSGMATAAEQTSTGAASTMTTSRELASMAESLRSTVDKFRLS